MNAEFEVLRDVVRRLEGAGIAYMLTGSVAMSIHAEPRMTRDIDIVVELASGDADRVVALFSPDYYVSHDAVRGRAGCTQPFQLVPLFAAGLRDVRRLLAAGVDEEYLARWAARLGVEALLEKCRDA